MLSNRYPATGGGERYKHFNYLYRHCCGRCDLPSHLQMVRQTQQGQQIAWWMLNHWNKKRRALECISGTSGGSFFVHMEHSHIFFAYWHYSICRSWNQYADESEKIKKSKLVTVHTPLSREVFWHENAKIPRHTARIYANSINSVHREACYWERSEQ